MSDDKLRRGIIVAAARLMYERQETEYYRAKLKAARRLCQGWVKPSDLPSNAEIRDEIQRMAMLFEGDSRFDRLRDMRLEALRIMRLLERCRPRVIGSTLTGHIRRGSDIDIHVFAASIETVTGCLDEEGMDYDVERKRVRKHGEERTFVHVHIRDRYPIELTVYPPDKSSYVFKSSITGQAMERASLREFEAFLRAEYPDTDLEGDLAAVEAAVDRFQVYRALLVPLETVMQDPHYHPEGDVLYHLLQTYVLAREALPYDEEFQLAALLHDVGKGLDPADHVAAGLEALEGQITPRTAWFIEHHMAVHQIRQRSLGHRAHHRLMESEDFDELVLLGECDRRARVCGAIVPTLDDALDELRELARLYG